jgi:hypothetical protein
MIIPEAFLTVCRGLHAEAFEDLTVEEVAQLSLTHTDIPDIPILESFIAELLSPATPDQDLVDLWFDVPGSLCIREAEGTRTFLRILRDVLAPRRALIERTAAVGVDVPTIDFPVAG